MKPKIYFNKVIIIASNGPALLIGIWLQFFQTHQSYQISAFIIYTKIQLRKTVDSTCCLHGKHLTTIVMLKRSSDYFRGKSSSDLNLIFIYFHHNCLSC